jgi:hypothetical protein
MSHEVWVDPRIEQVRVQGVQAYLRSKGWELQPYPGPELLVFAGPIDDDGEPVVQVLPSSERMRDYRLRLEELIAALSVMEGRPAADILTDILQGNPGEPAAGGNGAPGGRSDGVIEGAGP